MLRTNQLIFIDKLLIGTKLALMLNIVISYQGETVRKFIGSIIVVMATMGLAAQAAVAAPLVAAGSVYSFYLQGGESDNSFTGLAAFDGQAEGGYRETGFFTVNESETDLGNGQSLISIQIRSDGDLFPVLGETAIYGIGIFDFPLILTSPVSLYEARVSFLDAGNKVLVDSGNLAGDVYQNNPWDGYFPATDNAFGTEGVGGLGVLGINFDFFVSTEPTAVPEPAGALLMGLGLMAMLTTRRRRSH